MRQDRLNGHRCNNCSEAAALRQGRSNAALNPRTGTGSMNEWTVKEATEQQTTRDAVTQ